MSLPKLQLTILPHVHMCKAGLNETGYAHSTRIVSLVHSLGMELIIIDIRHIKGGGGGGGGGHP